METKTTTMVLLHGAGAGAWVWDGVRTHLQAASLALDLPCRKGGVTPASCAAELVNEFDRRGIGPLVLVMHSLSGVLAADLAQRLGPRLKACVFVSAIIPPPGGSFVDALGLFNRLLLKALFRFNPRGLKPSAAMIRGELCHDLSSTDGDLLVARYVPEWPGLYLTPTPALPETFRTAYVRLSQDCSLSIGRQDSMIKRLRTPRIHTIDSGHMVMLSQPKVLAQVLDEEFAHEVSP
jgi:pimeloyl-ACP methyl ester carboxylesterase